MNNIYENILLLNAKQNSAAHVGNIPLHDTETEFLDSPCILYMRYFHSHFFLIFLCYSGKKSNELI